MRLKGARMSDDILCLARATLLGIFLRRGGGAMLYQLWHMNHLRVSMLISAEAWKRALDPP